MSQQSDCAQRAASLFRESYGEGRINLLRAPARINILGEHVDYVSYIPTASLPFGSHEHQMVMAYAPLDDLEVEGASTLADYDPFKFTFSEFADEAGRGTGWEEYIFGRPMPVAHWSNYIKGAVLYSRLRDPDKVRKGFRFTIDSTIPPRGGSSSSSAIVVLAGAAIRTVNNIEFQADQLARESSKAEWYAGTRGGALDHTAICISKRWHAIALSYSDNTREQVPLPGEDYRWVTFFTHEADKGREVMLEYNERAAVSRLMIPVMLGKPVLEEARSLPEAVSLDQFAVQHPEAFHQCEKLFPALVRDRRSKMMKLRNRALHHFSETERVSAAVRLLRNNLNVDQEETARELGRLIDQSHASLRDLYDVSNKEVESLREILVSDPAVYGSRLMGGGFGGNILALIRSDDVEKVIDCVEAQYYGPRGRNCRTEKAVMVSTPGEGLSETRI